MSWKVGPRASPPVRPVIRPERSESFVSFPRARERAHPAAPSRAHPRRPSLTLPHDRAVPTRREPEELERTRTETNEEPPPGIFGAGSAFASSERRVETSSWRGGDPSAPPFPFPTVPAFDGRFPFPFGAFGDASPEAPTSSFGSHFFGSLAEMLSGLSDVAREMERLERGRTTEGATDPEGARTLAERNRGNDAPAPEKPEKASEESER